LAKRDGRYAPRALPKKKKNPEKEKPHSKNKKDTVEKKAPSWRHRVKRMD
jgi:hypothetical protein